MGIFINNEENLPLALNAWMNFPSVSIHPGGRRLEISARGFAGDGRLVEVMAHDEMAAGHLVRQEYSFAMRILSPVRSGLSCRLGGFAMRDQPRGTGKTPCLPSPITVSVVHKFHANELLPLH